MLGYHLSSCIASSSSCHCTSFPYTSLIHMLDYIEREGGVEGSVSFPTSILCLHRKLQTGSSISLFKTSNVKGFPSGSDSKGSACSAGDLDSVSGVGRSPGEGNDHSLQYSCLENSMDRGAWQATVHGVAESDMTERLTLGVSQVALVKNLPANAGHVRDIGLIPGLGISSGEGKGNPLQYPYLENPMDRSKPYKLEVWGRFAKSAVVVTSFTSRLTFTCTVKQCGGPEAHISSVLSTQTFPWISRGLCPHTSLSILLLPSAPHCKCKGIAVVENNEFYCFQVLLG